MKRRSARKAISLGGQPTFSWQLQEETQNSGIAVEPATPARSPRTLLVLASCLLLILVGGYLLWQRLNERAESNLALVEAEVAEAFTPDKAVLIRPIAPPYSTPASSSSTVFVAGTDADITLLELFGSLALVDVAVNNPSEAWYNEPYHVARIVQQDADGWKQIPLNNSFWNERRTLETTYFHIEYGRRDHAAVQEVAQTLDEQYLRFHDDLGLPKPGRGRTISLLITVIDGSEVRVTDVRYSGDTLYIAPPELISRPPTLSDGETLRQAIAYPLATKVFNTSMSDLSIPCYWRAFGEGVGLWMRWENHTLPSRRRWEYQRSIQEAISGTSLPTLADLRSIPRDCWQPPPFLEMDEIDAEQQLPREELSSTFIEFMAATYGRASVAAILQELRYSSDWNTLALKSVNVTADELEAGWHSYLEEYIR